MKRLTLPPSTQDDVRRFREEHGLTRKEFGDPLHLHEDRIGDLEDGTVKKVKPPVWLLMLITHDAKWRAKWLKAVEKSD